jgi:hypothetical protein
MEPRMEDRDFTYALTDPAFFAAGDPHSIWRRLRAEDSLDLTRGRINTPFWSVTKHEDALGWLSFAHYYLDHLWERHRYWTKSSLKELTEQWFAHFGAEDRKKICAGNQ